MQNLLPRQFFTCSERGSKNETLKIVYMESIYLSIYDFEVIIVFRVTREQMLYLRDMFADPCIVTVCYGKKKKSRHYYVEESADIVRALDDTGKFWAWIRENRNLIK